ncbi:MAG TPA: hypothetical protein VIJ41_13260 [Candidatus Nanopelagicales bacterium]
MSFVSLVVLATSPSPSPSLSQSTPTSPLPGENDPTWLGPGLLGFLSLVFLAVAVFVIYLSLNKQLGRVTFDEDAVNRELPEPSTGGDLVASPDQSDSEATETPSAQPSD